MAGVPFKLYLPSRQVKLGVVAQSLKHLHSIIKDKLDFAEQATLSLEDGTLICSEDYFELLEPQTTLVVQSRVGMGRKRSYSGTAEEVSPRKIYRTSNNMLSQQPPTLSLPPSRMIHPGHPHMGWVPCSPPNSPPPNCYPSGYPPALCHPLQPEFFPSTVPPAEQAAYIQQQLEQQHAYQIQQSRQQQQQHQQLSYVQQRQHQQVQIRPPQQQQIQVRPPQHQQQVQVRPSQQQVQQPLQQYIRQQEHHHVRVQMEVQRESTRTHSISEITVCSSSAGPISHSSSLPPTTTPEFRPIERGVSRLQSSSSLSSTASSNPTHNPSEPPKLLGPFLLGDRVQVTVPPVSHDQRIPSSSSAPPPVPKPLQTTWKPICAIPTTNQLAMCEQPSILTHVSTPPSSAISSGSVQQVPNSNILRRMVVARKLASNSTPPRAPRVILPKVSGTGTLTSVTNVTPRMVERAAIPQPQASFLQTPTPSASTPTRPLNSNSHLPVSSQVVSSHVEVVPPLHCSLVTSRSVQMIAHSHAVTNTTCSKPIPHTSESPSTTCPWVILSAGTCKGDSDVAKSSDGCKDDSNSVSGGEPINSKQDEQELRGYDSDDEGEGELHIDEEFVSNDGESEVLESQPSLSQPPSPPPLPLSPPPLPPSPPPLPPLPPLPNRAPVSRTSSKPTSLTLGKRSIRSSESPPCSDEGYLSATPMSSEELKQLPFSEFLSEKAKPGEKDKDSTGTEVAEVTADPQVQHCNTSEAVVETVVLQSKDDHCDLSDEETMHFTLEELVESNAFADECFKLELHEPVVVGGQEDQVCEGIHSEVRKAERDAEKEQVAGEDFVVEDVKAEGGKEFVAKPEEGVSLKQEIPLKVEQGPDRVPLEVAPACKFGVKQEAVTSGSLLAAVKEEFAAFDHPVSPVVSIKNEELEDITGSTAEDECEPLDAVDQLVVTYSIVCLDGQIVVPTTSDDNISVSSDFMDLDSDYEEEETKSVIDLTLSSGDEDDTEFSLTNRNSNNNNTIDEWYSTKVVIEEVDEVNKAADLAVLPDVAVAEYGYEVCVPTHQTQKNAVEFGEWFMGKLVNLLCSQSSHFKGMDKQCVFRLLSRVGRHSEEIDELGEYIPLERPSHAMPPCGKVFRYKLPHGKELRPAIHKLSRLFKH